MKGNTDEISPGHTGSLRPLINFNLIVGNSGAVFMVKSVGAKLPHDLNISKF